jgi:hypothetical protein
MVDQLRDWLFPAFCEPLKSRSLYRCDINRAAIPGVACFSYVKDPAPVAASRGGIRRKNGLSPPWPELRIISDDVWHAAKARQQQMRQAITKAGNMGRVQRQAIPEWPPR